VAHLLQNLETNNMPSEFIRMRLLSFYEKNRDDVGSLILLLTSFLVEVLFFIFIISLIFYMFYLKSKNKKNINNEKDSLHLRRFFREVMNIFKKGFNNHLLRKYTEIVQDWNQIHLIFKKLLHKLEEEERKILLICVFSLLTKRKSTFSDVTKEKFTFEQISQLKQYKKNGKWDLPIFYKENNENFQEFQIKKGSILYGEILTKVQNYKK